MYPDSAITAIRAIDWPNIARIEWHHKKRRSDWPEQLFADTDYLLWLFDKAFLLLKIDSEWTTLRCISKVKNLELWI